MSGRCPSSGGTKVGCVIGFEIRRFLAYRLLTARVLDPQIPDECTQRAPLSLRGFAGREPSTCVMVAVLRQPRIRTCLDQRFRSQEERRRHGVLSGFIRYFGSRAATRQASSFKFQVRLRDVRAEEGETGRES